MTYVTHENHEPMTCPHPRCPVLLRKTCECEDEPRTKAEQVIDDLHDDFRDNQEWRKER